MYLESCSYANTQGVFQRRQAGEQVWSVLLGSLCPEPTVLQLPERLMRYDKPAKRDE